MKASTAIALITLCFAGGLTSQVSRAQPVTEACPLLEGGSPLEAGRLQSMEKWRSESSYSTTFAALALAAKLTRATPTLDPKLVKSVFDVAGDHPLFNQIVFALTNPPAASGPLKIAGKEIAGTLVADGLIILKIGRSDHARFQRSPIGGIDPQYGPCFLDRSLKPSSLKNAEYAVFGDVYRMRD